jgi:hypothetical protein
MPRGKERAARIREDTMAHLGIVVCALAGLSLSCTSPAMLREYAARAAELSRNAQSLECAESAEIAARAALAALEVQSAATKLSTGATAPAARAAIRRAERECR